MKKIFYIISIFIKNLLKEFIKILFILIVFALKTFIKKSLKIFKKTFNTNNLILQIKLFYKNNKFAQRITYIKIINKRKNF